MADPLWSILMCGVPERMFSESGKDLLLSLLGQISVGRASPEPVEVLYLLDNLKRTVGAKRNALLDIARGEFISFVDDDDKVSGFYVQAIVDSLRERPADVTCFLQTCEHLSDSPLAEAGYTVTCRYSLSTPYAEGRNFDPVTGDPLHTGWWKGFPAHTMVWRASIAKRCRFPERDFAEDVAWVHQARALASTETQIEQTLYTYRFDAKRSLTRGA